jgi:hypothetical protein
LAAQDARPSPPSSFENPPLLYEGSDPTAGSFFPAAFVDTYDRIVPLPRVDDEPSEPVQPDASPSDAPLLEDATGPEFILPPDLDYGIPVVEEPHLNDFKNGFFQRVGVTATWLARGDNADGLGLTELDAFAMFAVPMPSREWPLVISPTFNTRWLDAPAGSPLPSTLYETYLDLLWLPRFTPRWTGIISVAPSLYTDFEVSTSEAWRLTGRALARFDLVPEQWQLLFGVLYLDRQDVRVLPAGGLIWTPSDAQRYELLFPRPKLAHRIDWGTDFEDWLYLGAEFGGNSFAYDLNGDVEIVTLRDYRIYLGLERKFDGGAGYRLEVGYAFSRSAEFASGLAEMTFPATAHLRIGASY